MHDPQKDCGDGCHSLFVKTQVQPLFWQLFLTEVLLTLTWSSSPLQKQMFPFRLPRKVLFSLLQEERENYVPCHYPLVAEGSRKYSYP